uniref:Uncharacterized protein n=1 Tax=Noccaea caerulescens TaxID=107243 RepID=A0A1J3CEJ5_NOCCA
MFKQRASSPCKPCLNTLCLQNATSNIVSSLVSEQVSIVVNPTHHEISRLLIDPQHSRLYLLVEDRLAIDPRVFEKEIAVVFSPESLFASER